MKRLVILFCIFTVLGYATTGRSIAGPPAIPPPPQGTAAELTAGTGTAARSWSPKTLADEFSGATAEVSDATVGAAGDTDITHAYSKDDIHDYVAQHDSDYDGLPDGVEAGSITAAMVAADVATQAELDTVAALVDTDDEIIAIINASPSTQIGVPAGGTGAGTFTDGGLLVGAGTGPFESLAVGLTTQVLVGGGAGTNPAWGTDLPTAVTIGSAYIYRAGGTDVPDADVADDITVSNYLPLAGGTMSDTLITDASDATASGLRLPHGAAPSAPTNGDLWTTTGGLYARINGSTVGPYGVGGATALDDIGNPDANNSISMAGYTDTRVSTTDGWGGLIIHTNVADNASPTTLLTLQADDANDSTNTVYLSIKEDIDGTPATLFEFKGRTLTLGTNASIEGIATLSASTSVTAPLYDVSGAAGITFGSADVTAFTFSGQSEDLVLTPSSDVWTLTSSTGATSVVGLDSYSLGAAGVKITGDGDGAITLLGLGDGSDEDLTINLDDTADTVVFSSSTGVTDISFSAMNISTTGVIKGRASYGADITGAVNHDTTATHGVFYHFTAAATVTLDAAADAGYGAQVCYRVRDAAEAAVIDVDAAEKINLAGTALAAGTAITATGAGESVCMVSTTDTDGSGTDGWEAWGPTSGWASQ